MNNSSFSDPLTHEPSAETAPSASEQNVAKVPKTGRNAPFGISSQIQTVVTYAFLLATLFTLFTPNNLFSGQMLTRVFQAWQANPTLVAPISTAVADPNSNRIGIVSGHWKNDSGSVCPDGLTEEQVNLTIASLLQKQLAAEGFQVDLLEEYDSRLQQYQAIALISIHNDTCEFISDAATGFKVAATLKNNSPEKSTRLTSCLADRYAARTGLTYRPNTTSDMTQYHAFDEIDSQTTAAIIETGFLNLDRQILTEKPDQIAQGIADGLLCFIRNESVSPTQTTP
ncbi:MAG: N-acetylmuramoyl-L-alanine amidase [Chloroflexi bacterium]|nr:N-acetylmuramoyl-L-alanine amidase [Chloroflexota bacterium]